MPARIVQARLDDETQRLLATLRRRTGLTESEIVRTAIRAMSETCKGSVRRAIKGVARFDSGTPDLGSNEEHLKGFGRS
jgi:hypothetical protein